jgi:DNA mismatch endonuclease (patch repair protein)
MRTKTQMRSATHAASAKKSAVALRSRIMCSVRRRDTDIELSVKELLESLRISVEAQPKDLPGQPDFVSRKRKWAIFVHGCFWHGHRNCSVTKGGQAGRLPATNRSMWAKKLERNRRRDQSVVRQLNRLGYRTLTVWGCDTRDPPRLLRRLRQFVALSAIERDLPLGRHAK